MAQTQVALGFPAGTNEWIETSLANAAETQKASAGNVFFVQIDNTANAAAVSYVKLYFTNGAVTVGTTVPDEVIFAPAATKIGHYYVGGKAFPNGMQAACVTAGGTAGTTSPTSAVPVTIIYS